MLDGRIPLLYDFCKDSDKNVLKLFMIFFEYQASVKLIYFVCNRPMLCSGHFFSTDQNSLQNHSRSPKWPRPMRFQWSMDKCSSRKIGPKSQNQRSKFRRKTLFMKIGFNSGKSMIKKHLLPRCRG